MALSTESYEGCVFMRILDLDISSDIQVSQVNVLLHTDNSIRLSGSGADWRRVCPEDDCDEGNDDDGDDDKIDGRTDLFSRMGVLESLAWAAPESMAGPMKPTLASDIYSFACVCVEVGIIHIFGSEDSSDSSRVQLFNGGLSPFEGLPPLEIYHKVIRGVKPLRPATIPDDLWDILCRCLNSDPTERPTAQNLLGELMSICHYQSQELFQSSVSLTSTPSNHNNGVVQSHLLQYFYTKNAHDLLQLRGMDAQYALDIFQSVSNPAVIMK